MDTIVIDGYNVIYAIPILRKKILKHGPREAREELIDMCLKYKSRRKDISCIYIVFDGGKYQTDIDINNIQDVRVLFSKGKREADDVIIEIIKKSKNPRDYIVVSSDNYVCNNSRTHSVRVMSPTAFSYELSGRDSHRNKRGTPSGIKTYKSEVTDWYRKELTKKGVL